MRFTRRRPKLVVTAVAGAIALSFGAGMATEYQAQDARWWRDTEADPVPWIGEHWTSGGVDHLALEVVG
jgi:hypothetical protein